MGSDRLSRRVGTRRLSLGRISAVQSLSRLSLAGDQRPRLELRRDADARARLVEFGAASLDGEAYQPFFADGQAQVDYVLGEFYWRVQVGEEVATDDYVRPGWMLSREANAQEVSWTLSELLDPKEIEPRLRRQSPRPIPGRRCRTSLRPIAEAAEVGAEDRAGRPRLPAAADDVPQRRADAAPAHGPDDRSSGQSQSATIGPVTVTRPYQLVSIRAEAPVARQWLGRSRICAGQPRQPGNPTRPMASPSAIRAAMATGRGPKAAAGATVKLAAVPAGTYDLVVDILGEPLGAAAPATYDYSNSFSDKSGSSEGQQNLNIEVAARIGLPLQFRDRHPADPAAAASSSSCGT